VGKPAAFSIFQVIMYGPLGDGLPKIYVHRVGFQMGNYLASKIVLQQPHLTI
jgi:hypothetical protein